MKYITFHIIAHIVYEGYCHVQFGKLCNLANTIDSEVISTFKNYNINYK